MNLNKIILFSVLITILYSCADYRYEKTTEEIVQDKIYYTSKGFALIYEDEFYKQKIVNKKINNDDFAIMHNFLDKNTPIQIINPDNSKMIESKIYKKAKYPGIFNVVISKKLASALQLDINNPYVELVEVKKNMKFIAKESNIFEEEKNVAEKAPVDEIKMDDLSQEEIKTETKSIKRKNFILVISDFYYEDSAISLMNELIKKTKINNISVKKINNKKYRLLAGPFKNFNALKTTYISLNNLGFENLNIFRK